MKKKQSKDKLNPKQKRFVKEYCVDLNGTQAAIRAGYSKKTANEQAAQILAKLSIQEAVKEEQSKIEGRIDITQDKVAQEIAKIAFAEELTAHKIKSLEMLGRHLGMFKDSLSLDVNDLGSLLTAARSRVNAAGKRKG